MGSEDGRHRPGYLCLLPVPSSPVGNSGDSGYNSGDRGGGDVLELSVLLPVISAVLLLLLLVTSLLAWRMMRRQKKGEGVWF